MEAMARLRQALATVDTTTARTSTARGPLMLTRLQMKQAPEEYIRATEAMAIKRGLLRPSLQLRPGINTTDTEDTDLEADTEDTDLEADTPDIEDMHQRPPA